jgi:hypothetical protein
MLRGETGRHSGEMLRGLERAADEALRHGELARVSELYREMAEVHYRERWNGYRGSPR